MRFILAIAPSSWASLTVIATALADEPVTVGTPEVGVPYTQITLQGTRRAAIGRAWEKTEKRDRQGAFAETGKERSAPLYALQFPAIVCEFLTIDDGLRRST